MWYNKKGEIGETITWLVATIIIIIMLLISIFVVSAHFRKYKKFGVCKERDLLVTKSLTSYLLTKDSGREIFYHLEEKENLGKLFEKRADEEDLGEFGYNLAEKIFSEFYKKEYIAHNFFFSSPSRLDKIRPSCKDGISEEIKLKENEHLLLILPKPK